ncbi:glyoxalase [Flindersiella endophytica]
MSSIESVTLEVPDPQGASAFYTAAFGLGDRIRVRASQAPTTGFRGFTLSLVVAQPNIVDGFIGTALDAGATVLKPATKSFWGYGGVVRDPDGAIWKIASSSKKNTGPANRRVDELVLLLGVADVATTKRFYAERGLPVAKSFGRKYVEFATEHIKLALYGQRTAAKDAGVSPEGTGSHRIIVNGDAGTFTDPDGFRWETTTASSGRRDNVVARAVDAEISG